MLSYQHTYHAGCFADVIKHLTLTNILHYLIEKDKPLLYLDTHSGRGCYDLQDPHALKTQEAKAGIALLWPLRHQLPEVFSPYIETLLKYNSDEVMRYYPGSPALAIEALRSQDRLVLCELHPREFEQLNAFAKHQARVHCTNKDGYTQLHALLPPKERRGLIMIDPAYEIKTEYRSMTQAVKSAYRRFAKGTYCIWYPLIDNKLHQQLVRGLMEIGAEKQVRAEFYLNTNNQQGMQGCGMWIINPPFQLKTQLKTTFNILQQVFHPKTSTFLIE